MSHGASYPRLPAARCPAIEAGYQPPAVLTSPLPRTYLVATTHEPFFPNNARRWAAALRDAGSNAIMTERKGSHGGPLWRREFPLMLA